MGSVATRLGVDSPWAGVVPFLLAVAVACGLALSTLPLRGRVRADGPLLAGAIGGWVVVVSVAPGLVPANDAHGTLAGAAAAVLVVALIGAAVVLALRYGPAALLPALPALAPHRAVLRRPAARRVAGDRRDGGRRSGRLGHPP